MKRLLIAEYPHELRMDDRKVGESCGDGSRKTLRRFLRMPEDPRECGDV